VGSDTRARILLRSILSLLGRIPGKVRRGTAAALILLGAMLLVIVVRFASFGMLH
jgi:hypothetical protein